ncbi:MAG: hypothetical protein BWY25_02772 [Chloroflexi bacterium ADurb.Bin222]|nr:MAG: hypothetical protein BWY25_02772 [Chloroflexi bacterium ADurb.Bin222]
MLDEQRQALFRGFKRKQVFHRVQHAEQVEILVEEGRASRLDFRHFQHVVDEREQVLPAAVDGRKAFPLLRGELRVTVHQRGKTENRIQGRAQLVAHIRQENALRAVRGFSRFFCPEEFLLVLLARRDIVQHQQAPAEALAPPVERRDANLVGAAQLAAAQRDFQRADAALSVREQFIPFRQTLGDGGAARAGFREAEHALPGGIQVHDAVVLVQDDDAVINAFDDGVERHRDDIEGAVAGDAARANQTTGGKGDGQQAKIGEELQPGHLDKRHHPDREDAREHGDELPPVHRGANHPSNHVCRADGERNERIQEGQLPQDGRCGGQRGQEEEAKPDDIQDDERHNRHQQPMLHHEV